MVPTPKDGLPEALIYNPWFHPDPPLTVLIDMVGPEVQQVVISEYVKLNIAKAQAMANFWIGLEKATKRAG